MENKEQEKKEGPRRIMVNSHEELVAALIEINKTLKVKNEGIRPVKKENAGDGRSVDTYRVVKKER